MCHSTTRVQQPFPGVRAVRTFFGRLLIFFLCGCVVSTLEGSALEHWHKRSHVPPGGDLYAVTYGGGAYVAVGQGIATSPDGLIWTDRSLDIINYYRSIIYFRDQFIIAGWTSPDGTQWTQPDAPVPTGGIAYGNGLFVTINWEGGVATSSDGINWTSQDPGAGNSLGSICFGNGTFVGTGPSGAVLVSTNGTNWSAHGVPTASRLLGLAFGSGMFVVAGESGSYANQIWTSVNGRNWRSITHPGRDGLLSIAFGEGTFVCVGDTGSVLSSTNGNDWYDVSLPIRYDLHAVAHGTNGFVAVGSDGTTLYSRDGFQWEKINSAPVTEVNAVAYGNGLFVAVGKDSPLHISTNGVHWFENPVSSDLLFDVTFGGGRFVAVGEDSLFTSVDGKQWTSHFEQPWGELMSVAYGGGTYVALGEVGRTSFDGTNWINFDIPGDINVNSVTFGNGLFVAGGGNVGGALTSTNGTNWTEVDTGLAGDNKDLAYGNGRFVAVCGLRGIMHSQDGIHWIDVDLGNNSNWLACVTFAWGTFVVGGDGGVILTSTNAESWTRINSGTSAFFTTIAYGSNSFIAVANGIRQSDPWPDAPRLEATFSFGFNSPAQLKLTGDVGRSYQIEAGPQLHGSWQPLISLPVTTNPVYWTDPQSTNLQKRFYRAVLLH